MTCPVFVFSKRFATIQAAKVVKNLHIRKFFTTFAAEINIYL